jgi:hypothetical protein
LIFGLFRETKIYLFRFVLVRFVSVPKEPKQKDLFRNKTKKRQQIQRSWGGGGVGSVFYFYDWETVAINCIILMEQETVLWIRSRTILAEPEP